MNKKVSLLQIMGAVAGCFIGLLLLVWSIAGCLDYSVGEAPLWRFIVGLAIIFSFAVFWVYMRTT